MGREDPIEFYIDFIEIIIFVINKKINIWLGG